MEWVKRGLVTGHAKARERQTDDEDGTNISRDGEIRPVTFAHGPNQSRLLANGHFDFPFGRERKMELWWLKKRFIEILITNTVI